MSNLAASYQGRSGRKANRGAGRDTGQGRSWYRSALLAGFAVGLVFGLSSCTYLERTPGVGGLFGGDDDAEVTEAAPDQPEERAAGASMRRIFDVSWDPPVSADRLPPAGSEGHAMLARMAAEGDTGCDDSGCALTEALDIGAQCSGDHLDAVRAYFPDFPDDACRDAADLAGGEVAYERIWIGNLSGDRLLVRLMAEGLPGPDGEPEAHVTRQAVWQVRDDQLVQEEGEACFPTDDPSV